MDPRAARIQMIGTRIYGEAGWQSRLARALDMTPQHISAVAAGARRVTPQLEERLARALYNEIAPELEAIAAEIRADALVIARELDLELAPAMTSDLEGGS